MKIQKMILLAVFALASLCFGTSAVSVTCHQRWPWNGKVDIDYVLQSEQEEPVFNIVLYGKIGEGETFRLRYLEGDGAGGIAIGAGHKKVVWDAYEQFPNTNINNMRVALTVEEVFDDPEYLVLDLDHWTYSYADTTNQTTIAVGSESKKSQMWFRKIEPGTFMMGSTNEWGTAYRTSEPLHEVQITKIFYIAIFPTTEAQYSRIVGDTPSSSCLPKTYVSYADLRGSVQGATWPSDTDHIVDHNSVIGHFRGRFDNVLHIDLPTEAQWELACRSRGDGTFIESGYWNDGSPHDRYDSGRKDRNLDLLGWYAGNSTNTLHAVGQKKPSLMGLYDMQGLVWEWTLDNFNNNYGLSKAQLNLTTVDPVGSHNANQGRTRRKGSYSSNAVDCRIASRRAPMNGSDYKDYGFRFVINMF